MDNLEFQVATSEDIDFAYEVLTTTMRAYAVEVFGYWPESDAQDDGGRICADTWHDGFPDSECADAAAYSGAPRLCVSADGKALGRQLSHGRLYSRNDPGNADRTH